jgi:glycosyltransferase involved in cell wall biosynthesis
VIRVMHLSDTLQFGGLERIISNVAACLDPKVYEFSACALDADGVFGEEIRAMGLPVFVLGKKRGVDISLPLALYRLFRTERIDILHTHNFSPLLYAAIPARLAGVKVLVHTEHARTKFPDAKRRMVAERWLSYVVDIITAVSPQVKRDLVDYEKISPDRVQLIWNGIDTAPVASSVNLPDLRRALGIVRESHIVGVCCRLTAQKGVIHLLRAVPAILAKHPDTVFLVVGDGDLRGELEQAAADLRFPGKVIFTGFRSDVSDILRILDLYVLPSLYEGTPLGLLEAMLARKVVIATKVGSNSEIIEDGISGRVVEPGCPDQLADAINDVLSNPGERERMAGLAYERVRSKFSLDRMMGEYDILYQTLLDKKGN